MVEQALTLLVDPIQQMHPSRMLLRPDYCATMAQDSTGDRSSAIRGSVGIEEEFDAKAAQTTIYDRPRIKAVTRVRKEFRVYQSRLGNNTLPGARPCNCLDPSVLSKSIDSLLFVCLGLLGAMFALGADSKSTSRWFRTMN